MVDRTGEEMLPNLIEPWASRNQEARADIGLGGRARDKHRIFGF